MLRLPKLQPGDKVAIVSPSFAAPAVWPHIHEFGLQRLRDHFNLEPVEYPTTRLRNASTQDRAKDLIAAFRDPQIKAVISTIGGDDQITYIRDLPTAPFTQNPKPFFGYSDNTHFANHLWLAGVPSFYGGCIFIQYARTEPDPFTFDYLRKALFDQGPTPINASPSRFEEYLDWNNPDKLTKPAQPEPNEGWIWDGDQDATGITWGGCVESIDELLRHRVAIPTLEQFQDIVLIAETSEETPSPEYVRRVFRGLGKLGILERTKALLVGRPQTWTFQNPLSPEQRANYRQTQRTTILDEFRKYNPSAPVVQNLDFGHTNPQICLPYGSKIQIDSAERRILVDS